MLKNVMMDNTIMANLVESYLKYAKGKKAIIFAVDIEHSKSIVERYLAVGIPAAHLDANTPKNGRKNILEKFKNGEILVLSNVDIVSEGFDVPDCEVVQLARPTKSLALFLQQAGRCGRPAPNKQFGIILDNAGLWLEHGIAYIDRDWSLEGVNKSKHKESPRKMIGFDEEDRIREIHWPVEAEGLELVEVNDDLERLLIFESYIRVAKLHEHKLVSVVYKYCDYLLSQKTNFTDYEMKYCHKRLNKEGCNYKIGFWYYRKIELSEKLKQDEYSRKLTAKPRF
jgi:superfamily II DNA or RNA helicase